jgi:hypothetical protein
VETPIVPNACLSGRYRTLPNVANVLGSEPRPRMVTGDKLTPEPSRPMIAEWEAHVDGTIPENTVVVAVLGLVVASSAPGS